MTNPSERDKELSTKLGQIGGVVVDKLKPHFHELINDGDPEKMFRLMEASAREELLKMNSGDMVDCMAHIIAERAMMAVTKRLFMDLMKDE